jgi:polyisoprenoid-binding protein YceI
MATTVREQAVSTDINATTWAIDPIHSNVEFSVKHMMIATVKGQFSQVEGTIQFDEAHPETASVMAAIDATSVTTFNEMRDNHLRTNDFFNAEQYPAITFQSTRVEPVNEDRLRVYGELTIRDVTRPVVLDTEYEGRILDAFGNQRVAFTATTEINRKDYGVNWNGAIEGGGVVVSDKVKITLHIAAVRRD